MNNFSRLIILCLGLLGSLIAQADFTSHLKRTFRGALSQCKDSNPLSAPVIFAEDRRGNRIRYNSGVADFSLVSSRGYLENDFFSIVRNKTENPIEINCSVENFKGANVYYHLLTALSRYDEIASYSSHLKSFYNEMENRKVELPLKIRIDVTHRYDDLEKFSNNRAFNNAVTICGILTPQGFDTTNPEIWFHPKGGRGGVEMALVPGVIYHEFFHLLSLDKLGGCHGGAVDEAYSNFFASFVMNPHSDRFYHPNLPRVVSHKLLKFDSDHADHYSTEFDEYTHENYGADNEARRFGFALLYKYYEEFKKTLGEDKQDHGAAIVLESFKLVEKENFKATLSHSVPKAMKAACLNHLAESMCSSIDLAVKTHFQL